MGKQSAGVLVYRKKDGGIEVLLVHPGGPYWAKKDDYAWSIPKGEYGEDEDVLKAARREFAEELGQAAPPGEYSYLGEARQAGGKLIKVWAVKKDLGEVTVSSNTFSIEWPPKSGREQEFPEVDRAEWFDLSTATKKLHPGQNEFLHRLADKLNLPVKEEAENKPPEHKLSDDQISLL